MEFLVREALSSDAEHIDILYKSLNGKLCNVLANRIALIAADPSNFLYVIERYGRIIGTAFVTLCLDPMYGHQPFAVMENIIIEELQRSSGAGTALLRYIETRCIESDCSKIMLLSSAQRSDAHRFFRAHGYVSDTKVGFVKYRSQLSKKSQAQ